MLNTSVRSVSFNNLRSVIDILKQYFLEFLCLQGSLVAQVVNYLPAMQEIRV